MRCAMATIVPNESDQLVPNEPSSWDRTEPIIDFRDHAWYSRLAVAA